MKTHPSLPNRPALVGALLLAISFQAAIAADPYPTAVLAKSPLAYWRLDESAAAPALNKLANGGSVGSSADGYAVLDVNKGQIGIVGNCIRLNNPGVTIAYCGSRVDVPYSAALNPNPPFSVEFWAKPNALPVSDTVGVCPITSLNQNWFSGANRTGWLLYCNNTGKWNLRLGLASGTYAINFVASTGAAAVGVWQHMVFTYDGSTAYLYANGVQIGTASATGWSPNPQSALRIGGSELNGTLADNPAPFFNATGQGHSGNRGWDGWVDEVAIYPTVLSAATVAAHHDAATTNNAGYDAQILADSPLGYWNMDEASVTAPDPSTFPIVANSGSLATDADGTNMWGSLTAQPGSGYAGLGGGNKACFLDSVNGYISVKDAPGLHFAGNITLMAWVKPTVQDFYRDIIAHGWDASHQETFLRISRGVGGTGAGDGNYYEIGATDNSTFYNGVLFPMPQGDIGNWVFLVGTYDGGNWNLYRNGVLAGSVASGNGALDVANQWTIGSRAKDVSDSAHFASDGARYGGWMDEPAIFSTALSGSDISTIYNSAQVPPHFTRQMQVPTGVYKGSSGSFNVWAEGSPALGHQWTSNGTPLAVSSSTTNVTLNNLSAGALTVAVVVTNAYGSATSSVSFTVVASKPLITSQPVAVTRYLGLPFNFSVSAAGTAPISYQWNTNGVPIAGANASTYSGIVSAATVASYSCTLSNEAGTSNSVSVPLASVAIPPGYASAIITNNVRAVAYWRLGEASGTVAHDYVGGNDGVYYSATLGLPGYSTIDPDTAAGFGNVNSYVGSINGTNVNFQGHANFTLECWVNGPANQADESSIIAKGNGSSGTTASEQFSLDVQNGNYHFFTRGGGNSVFEASADIGPNGTWHHVVCVYDDLNTTGGGALQMYLYVNGELRGQGGGRPSGLRASTVPVSIGSKHLGNSPDYDGYFTGTIDEVSVYPYAFSNSVVLAHYGAAYGPSLPPTIALEPLSVTNYASLNATFSVGAGGTVPLTYQWKKGLVPLSDGPTGNGSTVAGSSSDTLVITGLVPSDAGSYLVNITNVNGVTNSVAVSLTVLPPPLTPPAIPGLVLHLPFDNSLTDASGRGNNAVGIHLNQNLGVIVSNIVTPTYVSGALGQAMHFVTTGDGTGTNWNNFYASLGDKADLHFGSNSDFTVALWIQTVANMTDGDLPYLCTGAGSTFAAPGLVFAYTYGYDPGNGTTPWPGGWAFSVYDTAGNGVGGRGEIGAINDGNWHHLVHVFDRKNGNFNYLDGIPVLLHKQAGTSFKGAGDVDSGLYMNIGQDPTGLYGEPSEGWIDDLGIWKKALTPLEAASLYAAGAFSGLSFTNTTTSLPPLSIQKIGGGKVKVTWSLGTLQTATNVVGPYLDLPVTSPYTNTTTSKLFYRTRL